MKVSSIAALAALGFSGISSAANGFLSTCHHFDIHDLDGTKGRAVRLYAECKKNNGVYVQTNLDLNECFGWGQDCEFSHPDKKFSSTCTHCFNHWPREEDFGKKFGCEGYCDRKNEDGKFKHLSTINLDDYIGNNDGSLQC